MNSELRKILFECLFKEAENLPFIGGVFKCVPILKIANAIADDLKKIKDENVALAKCFAGAYNMTVIAGLIEQEIDIPNYSEEEIKTCFHVLKNGLAKAIQEEAGDGLHLHNFNNQNIADSLLLAFSETFFFEKTFAPKGWVAIENDQRRLKVFIQRNLPIYFYQLLENKGFEILRHKLESTQRPYQVAEYKRSLYWQALQSMYTHDALLGSDETDHPISLQHTYITPYFKIKEEHLSQKTPDDKNLLIKGDLQQMVYHFLRNTPYEAAPDVSKKIWEYKLLLLLGMPGQGKSSFCKRFLYDISQQNPALEQEVYFLRLRNTTAKQLLEDLLPNLTKEVNEQAASFVYQQLGIIESFDFQIQDIRKGILLLDGLDELEMSDNLRKEVAVELCRQLEELTEKSDLQVVITSRHSRVQENDFRNRSILWLEIAALEEEQQIVWVEKYLATGQTTKLDVELLEEYNQYKHIQELINQPILLHIIAQIPNKIDPEHTDRSALYNQLFTHLINRSYDKKGGMLKTHQQWEQELGLEEGGIKGLLRAALQELAFLIFQNEKEYVHKQQIVQASQMEALQMILTSGGKGSNPAIALRSLMMSFYVKNLPKPADDSPEDEIDTSYAMEFLHKSFQEYLAAEYIWRTLKDFTKELPQNNQWNKQKSYQINTPLQALERIAYLFENVQLTGVMLDYLEGLILRNEVAVVQTVGARLRYFMPTLAQHDFLYFTSTNTKRPLERIRNAFYNYWHLTLYTSSVASEEVSFVWQNIMPEEEALREHIVDLVKVAGVRKLPFQDLRDINLAGINAMGIDLQSAILTNSYLSRADLWGASLREADMRGANLRNSILMSVDLQHTDLRRADLNGSALMSANLIGANLTLTSLMNTNLLGAQLDDTNLRKTNFRGSSLRGARLINANLSHTDFSGANLRNVTPSNFYELHKNHIIVDENTILPDGSRVG